jgi:anaerobic sulfite reductase subunit A
MMLDDEDRDRAGYYRLLATVFSEKPSTEQVLAIQDAFDVDFADTIEEIGEDLDRLFVGSAARLQPVESLYNYPLGDRPRVGGRAAQEVSTVYSSAGLTIDEEWGAVPDHLAAELLFISYLIDNGQSEAEARFLNEHLLEWVPDFCDDLTREAETGFFRAVANLLKDLILSDSSGSEEG